MDVSFRIIPDKSSMTLDYLKSTKYKISCQQDTQDFEKIIC